MSWTDIIANSFPSLVAMLDVQLLNKESGIIQSEEVVVAKNVFIEAIVGIQASKNRDLRMVSRDLQVVHMFHT